MASPYSYDVQGQGGGIVLNASDSVEGRFRWIQVISDAVISDIASDNLTNSTDLVGLTLPAGLGFGGKITGIALTSGVVIAYFE